MAFLVARVTGAGYGSDAGLGVGFVLADITVIG